MVFVVVITGASSGLGAEVARQSAKKGFHVALIARTEEKLKGVQAECEDIYKAEGHTTAVASIHTADVSKALDFNNAFDAVVETHGRVDVLINNAGLGIQKRTLELSEEEFDNIMAVNTKSVLFGMQIACRYFQSLDLAVGHIINVSSLLGRVPSVNIRSAYCAAKHAVNSLTATVREELAEDGYGGIIVTGFHPGVIATNFGLNAIDGTIDSKKLINAQPCDEVAKVILSNIDQAQLHIHQEVQRIVNGGDADDGMFPQNGAKLYDVYSKDEYKEDIIKYYSAEDLGKHERHLVAEFRENALRAHAAAVRKAAGLQ